MNKPGGAILIHNAPEKYQLLADSVMGIRKISEFDNASAIYECKFATLEALWIKKRQGQRLPPRAVFSLRDLRQWISHIALVEAFGTPHRFRVNMMGMACVKIAGADLTGRWIDTCVSHQSKHALIASYEDCLATKVPTRNAVTVVRAGISKTNVCRLFLPCLNNEGRANVVIVAAYAFEERGRYYDTVELVERQTRSELVADQTVYLA